MNYNNGCLRKIVVACSVRNPTDSTTTYTKNLKTAFHRHVLCQYSVLNDICIIKWRRFFRNRPIRNKNCMWWPCLLTDRDEMSTFHRGHSIDASYQVSVHLAKRFQRRRCLKIGQSETRIACGGHVW